MEIFGRKSVIPTVINGAVSQTMTSPFCVSSASVQTGTPILPSTCVRLPFALKISPISVVVVVLPDVYKRQVFTAMNSTPFRP